MLYTSVLAAIATEFETYDATLIEALNRSVGSNKVLNLNCAGAKAHDYDTTGRGRYNIEGFSNGLNVNFNGNSTLFASGGIYPYSDGYTIKKYIESNSTSDGSDAYQGLSLGEVSALKEREALGDAAIKKIQAKLGSEWTIKTDWASVIKGLKEHYPGDLPYIYTIYERLYQNLANETDSFDSDVVEALNDAVGDKKYYNIRFGEKGEEYPGRRYRFDGFKDGVQFAWNPTSGICSDPMYPWSESSALKQYVLDNC